MIAYRRGYRFYHGAISLFLLIFFTASQARAESTPLHTLLEMAEAEQLHLHRYWEVLLHYKPSHSGVESLIDDPRFFLSENGKTDPAAELLATISAFFEGDAQGDAHPQCRFIARYIWLKEMLNIDPLILPERRCSEWDKLIDLVRPQSATLVFPAFFMNNPASMFGHTLIRIDGDYQNKLLSYASNYAAFTDTTGLLYPLKGIFGFYKGYFSLIPYYEMVKKYNDTEHRDIWEYQLNLKNEEVEKMLMHLWELQSIYSYYYFFDENCSFNLLFLLEAARPSLHLTDVVGPWAIPMDTVRIVQESGIVNDLIYRTARATKIRYLSASLSEKAQGVALGMTQQDIDTHPLSTYTDQEKTRILDLAIETTQYRYSKRELHLDDYRKRFLSTTDQRSKLVVPDEGLPPIPSPVPPHAGHLSSRVSFGAGVEGDRAFQEIGYRPAYHSFVDPDEGYPEGSQIVFANTVLRRDTDGKIRLEAFDLIDVASYSPRDDFFKPLSFEIKTGIKRDPMETLAYHLNSGVGLAYRSDWIGLYYGLVHFDFSLDDRFKAPLQLGGGVKVGLLKNISRLVKVNLIAQTLLYVPDEAVGTRHVASLSLISTFKLNQNNSLNFSVAWSEVTGNVQSKWVWNYYY